MGRQGRVRKNGHRVGHLSGAQEQNTSRAPYDYRRDKMVVSRKILTFFSFLYLSEIDVTFEPLDGFSSLDP